MISTSWFPHATIDVSTSWMMYHDIVWCHWFDAQMPQQMHVGLCYYCILFPNVDCQKITVLVLLCLTLVDSNIAQLMDTHNNWWVQALVDVAFYWLMPLYWCAHAMSDSCRPFLILHVVGWHRFLNVHKPWVVLHVIDLCRCRSADVHTSRLMFTCLGWWYMLFSNVDCKMYAKNIRDVKIFVDATYNWSMMPWRCMKCTSKVG